MQLDQTVLRDVVLLMTILGAAGKLVWDYANVKARLTALEKEDDKQSEFRNDMYKALRDIREDVVEIKAELKHRNGR